MGSRSGTTRLGDASSAQDRATRIVRELLERANGDWRIWASLSGVLQSLAEAAPAAFLDAVEAGLSGEQPVLLNLFSESESSLSGSSPHTGLLWALEVLAWSPEHLARASLLLAKLARLDPGGKLLNRPINSLRDIFLFWRPHTAASFDQRLRVLDLIRTREPSVAWPLLCKLVPEGHSHVTPTAKPKWWEWVPETRPAATWAEVWKAASEVTMRLHEEIGVDGARWAELIKHLGDLPPDAHNAVVDRLLGIRVSALAPAERVIVWSALRQVISRHRGFHDAEWAMPREYVDRLMRAYKRFGPREPLAKYSWLFSDWPAMIRLREEDWEAHHKALEKARVRAVRAVHKKGGVPLLLEMAAQIKRSYDVGLALGRSELLNDDGENELLSQELASANPARGEFARGIVIGREINRGPEWAKSTHLVT
jgi:hypothetical protein